MTREEFAAYIDDHYGIKYDCPFEDELDAWVFRHPDNKKWFALVMNIPQKSALFLTQRAMLTLLTSNALPK